MGIKLLIVIVNSWLRIHGFLVGNYVNLWMYLMDKVEITGVCACFTGLICSCFLNVWCQFRLPLIRDTLGYKKDHIIARIHRFVPLTLKNIPMLPTSILYMVNNACTFQPITITSSWNQVTLKSPYTIYHYLPAIYPSFCTAGNLL